MATARLAYIGLGSNLGQRSANMLAAFRALRGLGEVRDTSLLYETRPQYVEEQPPFLNAVCALRTDLGPAELLRELKRVEDEIGRVPGGQRFGPRKIDLDLVLFGPGEVVRLSDPDLVVPHPRLADRDFVLRPLCDVAPPELLHPVEGRPIVAMLAELEERQALAGLAGPTAVLPFPPPGGGDGEEAEEETLWRLGSRTCALLPATDMAAPSSSRTAATVMGVSFGPLRFHPASGRIASSNASCRIAVPCVFSLRSMISDRTDRLILS